MHILLTGAGSGVGRAVLDCLEGRRDRLRISGADMDPRGATVARCDDRYPLPPDGAEGFQSAVAALVDRIRPDLVIPCRDPHVPVLARLKEARRLETALPVGPPDLAAVMVDKWHAYLWSTANGIPFAASVRTGLPESGAEARVLLAQHGFPLIVKPRAGSASQGVRVVMDHETLARAIELPEHVLQPFYDHPTTDELSLDLTHGIPLFWEVPVPRQYAMQVLIAPDGTIGPALAVRVLMRLGRVEDVVAESDPGLWDVGIRAAEAMAKSGWTGPLNIQARPERDGTWRIFEYGGRFSGGTSARLALGLDEVGWTLNAWAGHAVVPAYAKPPAVRVPRFLTDAPVFSTPE